MKKDFDFESNEEIRWEGRPAPRCYTFRHWRHSCFGLLLLGICIYWQVLGFGLAEEYELVWLAWLPVPFLLMGIYLSVGHLLQARLEWNYVCYVITDRRLMIQRGLLSRRLNSMSLHEITYLRLDMQGDQLGTIQIYQGEERKLVLHCVEHPRQAIDLIEAAMDKGESANDDSSSRDVDGNNVNGVDS